MYESLRAVTLRAAVGRDLQQRPAVAAIGGAAEVAYVGQLGNDCVGIALQLRGRHLRDNVDRIDGLTGKMNGERVGELPGLEALGQQVGATVREGDAEERRSGREQQDREPDGDQQ